MLSGGRRGFTLMEILVVLTIGILVAAAVLPSLLGSLDQARVEESGRSLSAIGEAVGSMYADVGQYPGALSHLSDPVAGGDNDLCGTSYGGAAANWTGPYLDRSVPATGLPLPIGVADNTVAYIANPPLLQVTIPGVSHADARALNAEIDADADSLQGAVRWDLLSSGVVELYYVRPVRSC